jgi:hypothetical protein
VGVGRLGRVVELAIDLIDADQLKSGQAEDRNCRVMHRRGLPPSEPLDSHENGEALPHVVDLRQDGQPWDPRFNALSGQMRMNIVQHRRYTPEQVIRKLREAEK